MSSHHFVKEGQEPALLILDAFSLELAEPLLEWAPLVVVSDLALPTVLRWGIKVDALLHRIDRAEEIKTELADQFPVEMYSYRNESDILLNALTFLIKRKQQAVNVMAQTSDSLFDIANQFVQKIQVDVYDAGVRWLCIDQGKYEKWLPAKSRLKVRVEDQQNMESSGLTHQHTHWEVFKDGMVTLQSKSFFWIGEYQE